MGFPILGNLEHEYRYDADYTEVHRVKNVSDIMLLTGFLC